VQLLNNLTGIAPAGLIEEFLVVAIVTARDARGLRRQGGRCLSMDIR